MVFFTLGQTWALVVSQNSEQHVATCNACCKLASVGDCWYLPSDRHCQPSQLSLAQPNPALAQIRNELMSYSVSAYLHKPSPETHFSLLCVFPGEIYAFYGNENVGHHMGYRKLKGVADFGIPKVSLISSNE